MALNLEQILPIYNRGDAYLYDAELQVLHEHFTRLSDEIKDFIEARRRGPHLHTLKDYRRALALLQCLRDEEYRNDKDATIAL